MKEINPLHWHVCYSCSDPLVCSCSDRRQFDRETGKERRIYCFGCAELNAALKAAFRDEQITLEKESGHAEKIN